MMPIIVQKASLPYGSRMAAAVFRLLALFALMLMPIGMAPATAQPMPAEHAMTSMGHCEQDQDREPNSKMDCTAMCTALPATDASVPEPVLKPMAPRTTAIAVPFAGVEPETVTPPPRLA